MKIINFLVGTIIFGFVAQMPGANVFWSNTNSGPWNVATNWTANNVPASTDTGFITNGGMCLIDNSQAVTAALVILADIALTKGTLQMTGGSLTTSSDLRDGGNGATGGIGLLIQSGGTIFLSGGNLNVGFGTTASGTYTMSGGSLQVNSGGIFAVGNNGVGTINQSGGTIFVRNAAGTSLAQLGRNTATGPSSGYYNLSGGTLVAARFQFGNAVGTAGSSTNILTLSGTGKLMVSSISNINTSATSAFIFTGGTLTVMTNAITITNVGGILSPAAFDFTSASATNISSIPFNAIGTNYFVAGSSYVQGAAGTLAIDIGGVGNNDFVDIGAGAPVGSATLDGTISVNVLNNFLPALGSTFDILTADSIASTATVLGSSGSAFSTSIVTGGDGRQVLRLTVTAQPVVAFSLINLQRPSPGTVQFSFVNASAKNFKVWGTTNLANAWSFLGSATELSAGQYQFIDSHATNRQEFYQVSWP